MLSTERRLSAHDGQKRDSRSGRAGAAQPRALKLGSEDEGGSGAKEAADAEAAREAAGAEREVEVEGVLVLE